MARFRAYSTDSSDDDDESNQNVREASSDHDQWISASKKGAEHSGQEGESDGHHGLSSGDESSSSSSSTPPRRKKKLKRVTSRNAGSEGEDDEVMRILFCSSLMICFLQIF